MAAMAAVALCALTFASPSSSSPPGTTSLELSDEHFEPTLSIHSTPTVSEYTAQIPEDDTGEGTFYISFDKSATAPTSIEFGVRIDTKLTTVVTDTDGVNDRMLVSASGCSYPSSWPDVDDLGEDGNAYYKVVARVGPAPESRIAQYNYRPVRQLSDGAGSFKIVENDTQDWAWSGPITDAGLLADFTGTGTKRVYYDFSYDAPQCGSFDSLSSSGEVTAWGGIRFNY